MSDIQDHKNDELDDKLDLLDKSGSTAYLRDTMLLEKNNSDLLKDPSMLLDDKYTQQTDINDMDDEDFSNFMQSTSLMLDEFEHLEKM